jgi:hypothetical protein
MPIQFRCPACDRMLGIARRKAGTVVSCPRCGADVRVPALAGMAVASAGPGGGDAPVVPVIDPLPAKNGSPRTAAGPPMVAPLENLPLFERPDFESLLNPALAKAPPADPPPKPPTPYQRPAPRPDSAADLDVLSGIVISRRNLTLAAVAVAVLVGLAFGAGYALASMVVAGKKAPPAATSPA